MADVPMPRLSDSMEEGTILKWLKSDGDSVAAGEELVEIETDKANMTYEAEAAGTLAIVAKEGETLAVGATMARIGAAVERAPEPQPAPAAEPVAEPEPEPVAEETNGRVKASPVARRIARERGLELASVTGTGPGGRIVKSDVEAAAGETPATPPAAAPAPAPAVASGGDGKAGRGEVSQQELTRLQQTVARRMAESKATAPDFTIALEVDMDAAVELRAQLKTAAGDAPAPSYNDFVVKAAALALREFPRANGAYRDGRFELYSRVNVGIAVAGQDALVVPTVFDADQKSLGAIAREARALAERVRSGAITPPELSAGTFTVSNIGMYGIRRFTPVINPPQAAILAVGELAQRPVVRDGEIVARHVFELTLVSDHRILYGADAAAFLARIRQLLEQPLRLAL
ncbi:dihydrolipoamide acetyltransferase family protein [Candidatus Solirubrobacter pratensis]|uniref:dihydrolipoamide acetyltransferase family protein n=1 Tax=Candidatus Solirubrobacter pratensis TaxID=1298857 RepID=UPI00040A82D9|nr:dihydrolipoamide acetyltransferase family protein [Candidatus Solirubrobacter pratensis]